MTSNWETVRIGDVADVIGGATPKSGTPEFWGGEIQWLTPKDLSKNPSRYTSCGERTITEEGLRKSGAKLLPAGAVLLTSRAPVGYVSVAAGEIATNQGFKSLVLKDGQLPEYWYYLLGHSTGYLRANSGGSTFQEISGSTLKELVFDVPPFAEQRRIVDLIGSLDDAIEAADEAMKSLTHLFSESLRDLVGPLSADKDHLLSKHFRVIDCEHKTAPSTDDTPFAYSVGTAAIRGGGFVFDKAKAVSEETFTEWTERAIPSPGDVVMSREAPVGQVALVTTDSGRICLGQRTVLIRPIGDMSGELLWALLLSGTYQDFLSDQSIGLTVQRVNVKTIKETPLPMLTKEKQEAISALSQSAFEAVAQRASLTESLRSLRSEMLTSLLSGAHTIPESYDELLEAVDA